MTCANCQKTIAEDSLYCEWCGHQVGAPLPARRPMKEGQVILGGLISFLGVAGIILGTLVWAAAGWSKSSYDDKVDQRLGLGLFALLAAAIVPYVLLRVKG